MAIDRGVAFASFECPRARTFQSRPHDDGDGDDDVPLAQWSEWEGKGRKV